MVSEEEDIKNMHLAYKRGYARGKEEGLREGLEEGFKEGQQNPEKWER